MPAKVSCIGEAESSQQTKYDRVSRAQVALVEEQLMARLRETVEGAGGRLDPGWGVEVRVWLSAPQQVGRAAMCTS